MTISIKFYNLNDNVYYLCYLFIFIGLETIKKHMIQTTSRSHWNRIRIYIIDT